MSKVSIEINGLKFGLRIRPETAIRLVEALQEYWVAVQHRRPQLDAVGACNRAFDEVIGTITVDALAGEGESEPDAQVISLDAHRR